MAAHTIGMMATAKISTLPSGIGNIRTFPSYFQTGTTILTTIPETGWLTGLIWTSRSVCSGDFTTIWRFTFPASRVK